MNALFHYCNTDTFVAMLHGRSIWLSSVSLSNDTMEGRLVNHTLMLLAQRDNLDIATQDRLKESVGFIEDMFDGLGFCLSEDGDLLSQWRGYADDARGVSVGFGRDYLYKLAEASKGQDAPGFALHKVEYEPDVHKAKVEPTYQELRQLIDAGAFKFPGILHLLDSRTAQEIAEEDDRIKKARSMLFLKLLELFPHLFSLKKLAFKEEREWRLVSTLVRDGSDTCLFRSARNRVVPYRSYALHELEPPSIVEVVLGPKHETPVKVVQSMLKINGFGEVAVRRSEATYR